MDFRARYHHALRLKSPDVEEPVDMFWHRPLAAAATALVLDLPLTPNQITWMSLFVGTFSSAVYWATAFGGHLEPIIGYPIAALLLFLSVVLDCMDGQFARAKGGGTRMGRILDGAVDVFVLLPFYVLMVFDVGERHGQLWFWVVGAAGITSWIQILVYDRLKSLYLTYTLDDPSTSDAAEDMEEVMREWAEIKSRKNPVDIFLFGLYVHGQLKFSALFAGKKQKSEKRARNTPEQIRAYRTRHHATMRLITNVGLGTHMLFIYVSVALMAFTPWATVVANVLFLVLGNLMLLVGQFRARDFDQPVVSG